MPAISLVVCLYRQRDLLERLLQKAGGCYDELVVSHDGPDVEGVKKTVEAAGGRFFEHPRIGSLEGQSPAAWGWAGHDWILRLDADEFPSEEMKVWLKEFRQAAEPAAEVSGYTCIWPLWNGRREVTKKISPGRIFLFHKQRVRFFGLIEQVPLPDGIYQAREFVLHHQPKRKSYGLHNVLVRKQAYHWRDLISQSLLGKPTDLPCWRWNSEVWPLGWEQIRRQPVRTAFKRLIKGTFAGLREQWKTEHRLFPAAALSGPLHQALICLKYCQLRRRAGRARREGPACGTTPSR
jgi:hypothetical protein